MQLSKKPLKLAGDFFYTIMATVVMNIALQIIIYPLITRFYGESVTGNILYFIGFIYIIPQAFGGALLNARLVVRKSSDTTNGDYTRVLVISSAITALLCGYIGLQGEQSLQFSLLYAVFSIMYFLRIYAQVEFRLTLKFKAYFLYYCIISLGYLLGLGLFFLTGHWLLIFILGEGMALLYSLLRGKIFKTERATEARLLVHKTIVMLAVSTLMRDAVLHFDKVFLKQSIDSAAVTQYHVVSLIAKTMQMLIQPINALIMTYLTAKDAVLSRKKLVQFTGIAFLVGGIFYGICIIGTPIFIKLFYASLYEDIIGYNLVVNLGLILSFLSSMFLILLLSQGKTKLYTAIECFFSMLYIVVAYFAVSAYAIWGLAYATLGVNVLRIILSVVILLLTVPKQKAE